MQIYDFSGSKYKSAWQKRLRHADLCEYECKCDRVGGGYFLITLTVLMPPAVAMRTK